MQAMAQNLLVERFKLKFRRETREMPVFSLLPAKGGLKISRPARHRTTGLGRRFGEVAAIRRQRLPER